QGLGNILDFAESGNGLAEKLSKFHLKKDDPNSDSGYYEFSTRGYNIPIIGLSGVRRKFAEQIFSGRKESFRDTMNILHSWGINTIRIYLFTPEYVNENTIPSEHKISICKLVTAEDQLRFHADVSDTYKVCGMVGSPRSYDPPKRSPRREESMESKLEFARKWNEKRGFRGYKISPDPRHTQYQNEKRRSPDDIHIPYKDQHD
ncbi:hypothetical protein JXC34_00750, partial [Candidatus Woesearchaeota archaeon]|nr:hypothetical protein [Candidatus Woesearchaeota archaeon]